MIRNRVRLGLAALVFAACGGKEEVAQRDSGLKATDSTTRLSPGEAYLAVPDGRIWYRKVGSGTGIPVILVHGGPGYSSYYLKSLEGLGGDRPVIRYDQLGGGKSDRITDTTWDNPEAMLAVVRRFLASVDRAAAKKGQ